MTFCGSVSTDSPVLSDLEQYNNWDNIVTAAGQLLNGAAPDDKCTWLTTDQRQEAEQFLYRQVQRDNFCNDMNHLMNGKELPSSSRFYQRNPFYNNTTKFQI